MEHVGKVAAPGPTQTRDFGADMTYFSAWVSFRCPQGKLAGARVAAGRMSTAINTDTHSTRGLRDAEAQLRSELGKARIDADKISAAWKALMEAYQTKERIV